MFKPRVRDEDKKDEPQEAKRRETRSRDSGDKSRRKDSTPIRKSNRSDNRLVRYFQETAVELRKVVWPSRATATRLVLIVLGALTVFAIFFGALDFLFQRLVALMIA